jgi:hypothetical protein
LQAERVGVLDNFFELGGHSLLVTRMVSLLRWKHDLEISIRNVFELGTIRAIADYIRLASTADEENYDEFVI